MTTTSGETLTDETRLTVLETRMEAVQEGQRQILARLDAMQQNTDAHFDAMQQNTAARFDAMQQNTAARFDAMQRDTNARFDALNARFDTLNARFDRLFYTILGLGVAGLGLIIALEKVF